MLEIKELQVKYGNQPPFIEHFNLNLKDGEILSIVGESGSGKSTLIRSIIGALPENASVTADKMEFFGSSLLDNSQEQWRKLRGTDISMIFQDSINSLNPIRKIGKQFTEYICTHQKMPKREAARLAEEMLGKMHLAEPARVMNSYPFQLSGGMMQRVGIAMAMTFSPKLLLADEPTSALDVTIQAQIVKQMMELRENDGTSILIVTHNVGVAAYMSDRMIVMKQGKVVDQGRTKDVLKCPSSSYTKELLEAVPDMEGIRYV